MPGKDQPSDAETYTNAVRAVLSRFQCSFPAIVTAFEAADGRVTVQPAIMIASASGQQTIPKPVTIPVAWGSWGKIVIQGVLEPGDEVLVRCQDKNWSAWLLAGGVVGNLAPGGHQSGYAVAEPTQLSVPRRPPPMPTTAVMRVGTVDGKTTIIMGKDGSVSVQSAAVSLGLEASPKLAVARDSDGVARTAAFETWQQAVSAAAGAPVLPPGPLGTVSATSTEVSSS